MLARRMLDVIRMAFNAGAAAGLQNAMKLATIAALNPPKDKTKDKNESGQANNDQAGKFLAALGGPQAKELMKNLGLNGQNDSTPT
jgi:hypothetical protein